MALDFYKPGNNDLLFRLNEEQLDQLSDIFIQFKQWTGLIIDPYGTMNLTTENQVTLISVIDKYINSTDLNKDKQKTVAIIEFRGLLNYFSKNKTDLRLIGD
jgi:hypothetical protein